MKKTKSINRYLVLFLGGLLFCSAGMTKAQTEGVDSNQAVPPKEPSIAMPTQIQGTANCFDYYNFGSMQVDLSSEISSTVPGVPMAFNGKIINNNDYPIVGGSVYVKIFKKQTDLDKAYSNENFLVDQFLVEENISIQARESKELTFNWTVPKYIGSGEYQLATFFISENKFNLLGLSFTDDVIGNTFDFSIGGENKKIVEFNKNNVSINEEEYHFAAYPPRIDKEKEVLVKADLVNNTDSVQLVPVKWTLYFWDGQNEKNIIDTTNETILIEAGKTRELGYRITDNKYPVYYLVAEAKYNDAKSILDIRFVRQDIDRIRLNFPAVIKYPLQAGEQNTVFSCLHNSGIGDIVKNNKLTLTLLDEDNKEIHKYEYSGDVSGAMMGLKDDFTPKDTYSTFTLKADLYTGDELVDSAEMKYECDKLDPKLCQQKKAVSNQINSSDSDNKSNMLPIIIFLIFAIGIIAAVALFLKKRRSGINVILLAIILSAGMFFGIVKKSEAASATWTQSYSDYLSYQSTASIWTQYFYGGMHGTQVNIGYNAYVYDNDTNQLINPGSVVSVGTKLRFEQVLGDISYSATGTYHDTPNGEWVNGAIFPDGPTSTHLDSSGLTFRVAQCSPKYFVTDFRWPGLSPIAVFIPLSVNPPSQSVSQSGNAALSCAGNICTVVSPGTITANFNFSNTYGYFYYEYDSKGWYAGCHTSWDVIPMQKCQDLMSVNSQLYAQYSAYNNLTYYLSDQNCSPFRVEVPARTISYSLTAVAVGNPPADPTVSGPANGYTNTAYSFTATSTDPDNDQIRYAFDWNNDGSADQFMPLSGYVNSGTAQAASYSWATNGVKTFKVLAQDKNGLSSNWVSKSISITTCTPSPQCVSFTPDCNKFQNCGKALQASYCVDTNYCGGTPVCSPACTETFVCPCPIDPDGWKEVAPQ